MMRTGIVITLLTLTAAPAFAQVEANANANANVNVGGGGGGDGLAPQGFLMGARLVVDSPTTTIILAGGVPITVGLDMIPRYYLGYRLGRLGFVVGFNLSSTSSDVELPGDDAESSDFLFALAPQVLFEVTENGVVGLDIFAGPIIASGSHKDADPDQDAGIFGFGLDAGARLIGYVARGVGLHADIGLNVDFLNSEVDAAPNDRDETDWSVIGFYGAMGIMGTL